MSSRGGAGPPAFWEDGRRHPVVGATFPLAEAAEAHRADRGAPLNREGRARAVTARWSPAVRRDRRRDRRAAAGRGLRRRGARPRRPASTSATRRRWDGVGPVDLACSTPASSPARPTSAAEGRAVPARGRRERGRRRARRAPARARVPEPGSTIVCTASLAGSSRCADDPSTRARSTRRRLRPQRRARSSRSAGSRSTPSAPARPTPRCRDRRQCARGWRPPASPCWPRGGSQGCLGRAPVQARPVTRGSSNPAGRRSTTPSRASQARARGTSPWGAHSDSRADPSETSSARRRRRSSGSAAPRPCGAPRRGRRRCARRAPAAASSRAASRPSGRAPRAPARRGRSRR